MRRTIRTPAAPAPAASYEQGVAWGDLIFVAGQTAADPLQPKTVGTTIGEQVTQALRNVEAVVEAGGGSRKTIVRCGVFLADLADFAEMDRAFRAFFGASLPARTTVQVGLGALRVEIDAIAVGSAGGRRRG